MFVLFCFVFLFVTHHTSPSLSLCRFQMFLSMAKLLAQIYLSWQIECTYYVASSHSKSKVCTYPRNPFGTNKRNKKQKNDFFFCFSFFSIYWILDLMRLCSTDACLLHRWCWRWRDKCKIQNNTIFDATCRGFSFIRFGVHNVMVLLLRSAHFSIHCKLRVNKKGVEIEAKIYLPHVPTHTRTHTRTQRHSGESCRLTHRRLRLCDYLWFLIASSTGIVSMSCHESFTHSVLCCVTVTSHKRNIKNNKTIAKAIFSLSVPNHRDIAVGVCVSVSDRVAQTTTINNNVLRIVHRTVVSHKLLPTYGVRRTDFVIIKE